MKYGIIEGIEKPVSRLICGTASKALLRAEMPDASTADKEAAFAILDKVSESGINTFDCAAIYGEIILGEWMEKRGNRDDCVIISKCAHPNAWRHRVTDFDILSDLHDSLKKLRTSYVDLYLLHRDCQQTPVSQIIDVMNRLYDEKKIKRFGTSNWTHTRIEEANNYAIQHGLLPFSVSSPQFSLAEQIADPWAEAKYSDPCVSLSDEKNRIARNWYSSRHMPVIAYSPLAHGFFSGRFTSRDSDEKIAACLDGSALIGYYCPKNIERLKRCEQLAGQKNCTVSQIALAWVFAQSLDIYTVTGASAGKHLEENISALDISLTSEECAWLDLETEQTPSSIFHK